MSLIPAQFSEARAQQLDAQFNLFRTFTGKAFEGAEKLIALHFDTTRSALEKSTALVRQVAAAKDPRDLIAITGQTQSQFESVLAYGRQLFGIATSMAVVPPAVAPAVSAPVLAAPAPAPVAPNPEPQPAVVMPEPVLEFGEAPGVATPIAEPPPIAKATGQADGGLPKPAAASFPVPSSTKPIAVAAVKPVEAQPPHAPVSGTPEIVKQQAEATPAKPARKK
ncbi:phasin family protein [Massilia sp. R2A-15]|uniref:phasin family protein n=1 Tax=Massilia sp. R2A-15 TaxID=3064278 RepID=UPI0027355C7C|nr:phasin family protein [Massilia sp. R2A-15]WLI88186.1 phasin family protein [Massilia sp. R2A-15]